jgi:hypothetical protein
MGLDMFAYSASKAGANAEYWENYDKPNPPVKPKEISYWRKHPNLHGWMEQLWHNKNEPGLQSKDQTFNGIELELTEDDINQLEYAVKEGLLPPTSGFFFGDGSDDYYKEQDLEFIAHARADLFCGLRVFYNSSW